MFAQEPAAATEEDVALAALRLARVHFNRGEYTEAIEIYDELTNPRVRLSSREALHEAFLYYAFTLFLQGNPPGASEKLAIALQLKPTYEPSPVTTRPDLLGFYSDEQKIYVNTFGEGEAVLKELFPELAPENPGGLVTVRRRFFPYLVGLRQLGHPHLGATLTGTQAFSLAANLVGFTLIATHRDDISQRGYTIAFVGQGLNIAGFAVFLLAVAVEGIVSLALWRYYKRYPERLRTTPRVSIRPDGFAVHFW